MIRALAVAALANCAALATPAAAVPVKPAPIPAPILAPIIALPLQPVVPPALRTCALKTVSGLGTTALKPGEGARPGPADYVLVNYIGYLAAGGQTFDQGMSTPMRVDRVVPGFAEGLQLLQRGGITRICLPAALAYGKEASGPIPANADLVFQIELLDFRTVAEVEAMRQQAQPPPPAAP